MKNQLFLHFTYYIDCDYCISCVKYIYYKYMYGSVDFNEFLFDYVPLFSLKHTKKSIYSIQFFKTCLSSLSHILMNVSIDSCFCNVCCFE